MMRGLVLGAVLCVALGLPAKGAAFRSDGKATSVRPLACHWVTADRTLRLLRFTAAHVDKGVTGVASDRRSPEYLAKFVADEIARWEGPIKSAGLQVD
jgi:hypothetical protein